MSPGRHRAHRLTEHRAWAQPSSPDHRRDTAVTISACLIVRNESLVLERCLSSLSGAVDEIVVVDTGSTDATPEIAAGFGARVCRYDWCDDFSAARNVGLDAASCDWVLTIDAHEYLVWDGAPTPNGTSLRSLNSPTSS